MPEMLYDCVSTAVLGNIYGLVSNAPHDSAPTPSDGSEPLFINPLLTAAKAMWKIKEKSRREVLLGVLTAAESITHARQKRYQGDLVKRVWPKVGHLQHLTESDHDIDHIASQDLLNKVPFLPLLIKARLRRTAIRWRNTIIQDFFPLDSNNSKKMVAKLPLPTENIPSFAVSEQNPRRTNQ